MEPAAVCAWDLGRSITAYRFVAEGNFASARNGARGPEAVVSVVDRPIIR